MSSPLQSVGNLFMSPFEAETCAEMCCKYATRLQKLMNQYWSFSQKGCGWQRRVKKWRPRQNRFLVAWEKGAYWVPYCKNCWRSTNYASNHISLSNIKRLHFKNQERKYLVRGKSRMRFQKPWKWSCDAPYTDCEKILRSRIWQKPEDHRKVGLDGWKC